MNLDAFIEQARDYDAFSEDCLGEMLKSLQTAQLTHPVPVIRAREIDRWGSSFEYQSIISKRNNDNREKVNISGGWRNW
mgnify:CR=1 FL=1